MVKKIVSLTHLVLIAALLLTGCGLFPAQAEQRPPLRVEYTIWEGDYTLLVAQEKGFFEKHGVKVEPVFYETFSRTLPDLASKRIDAGLLGIGDLLNAARVTDVKGVAVYDSGGTIAVVSRSDIQKVTDLRGQNIGVNLGSSGELFVHEMLNSAGMTLKDVQLINVDPESVTERLSQDLAAGFVWAPYDQHAQKAGYRVLFAQGTIRTLSPDLIVFRGDVVEERPDDVRAFLAAWFEAFEYRQANPAECNVLIAEKTGQSVEDVAASSGIRMYNQADNLLLFDRSLPEEDTIYYSAEINLDFLITRGAVTVKPDLDKILDPSILQ